MLDRTAVGRSTAGTLNEVEAGAIRRFAASVGDTSPLSFDTKAARDAGYDDVVAPPTFPVTFSSGADLREVLGVPVRHLLLAEQTWEYARPIVAGDRLTVKAKVADITERSSPAGRVEVAVISEEGLDAQGRVVFRGRRTYVVRAVREG
ncbi:MAG: MaoC family dehydratase N-terminal domain-containing protein [Archangium sp.]|nr:MaoC family dehydratase N-terminal domain-containing protein [Archangium sp.]